jgi:hypothetical protein
LSYFLLAKKASSESATAPNGGGTPKVSEKIFELILIFELRPHTVIKQKTPSTRGQGLCIKSKNSN